MMMEDRERKLTSVGAQQAMKLGEWIKTKDIQPDLIYCSTATRAKQTLEQLDYTTKTELLDDLYHASADTMFKTLWQTEPQFQHLMLISHNPGIGYLAGKLAAKKQDGISHKLELGYPPATCAVIDFHCPSWQDATEENAKLADVWLA